MLLDALAGPASSLGAWYFDSSLVAPVVDEYRQNLQREVFGFLGKAHLHPGRRYMNLFLDVMRSHCHDLVWDLADAGIELCEPDLDRILTNHLWGSAMAFLLEKGFARIAAELFDRQSRSRQQKRQRLDPDATSSPTSWFLAAAQATQPNLPALELVVDRCGIDWTKPDAALSQGLHLLAKGRTWWHIALALPYLLRLGIDMDLRHPEENLHREEEEEEEKEEEEDCLSVCSDEDGLLRHHANRLLVEAGVRSPSATISQDHALESEYDAEPTSDLILSAIEKELPDVLDGLPSRSPQELANELCRDPEMDEELERYSFHHGLNYYDAQRNHDGDSAKRRSSVIRLLLNHGTDPFATYPSEHTEARRTYPGRNGD